MTVWVTREDGVVEGFSRSADHFIEHYDGSLEVIRGGTAPPETYPVGRWTAVRGDGTQEARRGFRHFISRLLHPSTG
jgi:hypothetical protein